jgi:pimeloyl-ACP methyl ester carboxylesterase
MFGFKKKPIASNQPSSQSRWHAVQRRFDTIVFVHGILGGYGTTWGQFHDLLHTDDDLPILDILSWGYRSGFVPGSYQDVETEGEALVSDMESLVADTDQIFLVGHSMGGLVILKGVINRIRNEHGQKHPIPSVNRIVLYATPLLGSAVANVVLAGMSVHRYLRWISKVFPRKQIRDLQRGEFCDKLNDDVVNLVYRPDPASKLASRAIRVLACAGKHDRVVSKSSATGVFKSPPPKYLEGDHGSVKLPDHHGDSRYLALKNEIVEGLATSFHILCVNVMSSSDPSVRMAAARRLDEQYGPLINRCVERCVEPRTSTDADRLEISSMIWAAGAKAPAPPASICTQVYTEYKYKNDPRLIPPKK